MSHQPNIDYIREALERIGKDTKGLDNVYPEPTRMTEEDWREFKAKLEKR